MTNYCSKMSYGNKKGLIYLKTNPYIYENDYDYESN